MIRLRYPVRVLVPAILAGAAAAFGATMLALVILRELAR